MKRSRIRAEVTVPNNCWIQNGMPTSFDAMNYSINFSSFRNFRTKRSALRTIHGWLIRYPWVKEAELTLHYDRRKMVKFIVISRKE